MTVTTIPQRHPYLIQAEHVKLLGIADRRTEQGTSTNVLIRGAQGTGKSDLVSQFAASRQRPLAVLEVGRLAESREIFGYMELRDGRTNYVKGLFTDAITTPNCVVHLQEINRPESDKALNAIFSVLDDIQRSIWIDELGESIKVASGVTFFASLNEGYEFIGTLPLDAALEDRFHIKMKLGPLPEEIETNLLCVRLQISQEAATEIVGMVNKLRTNAQHPLHVSTRDIIFIAEFVQLGLTAMEAVKAVIGYDQDKLEGILLAEHLRGHNYALGAQAYELL